MEKSIMDEERDKIRELHQRQQNSLKSLQALENRFCHIAIDDEETLQGSSITSRSPTLEFLTKTPAMEVPPLENLSQSRTNTITIDLSAVDDSDTSDTDTTMADDDIEERISTEQLAKAADHVKKLLKRITVLQNSFNSDQKTHRKRHVHKMYQRFCRKFESGIDVTQAAFPSAHDVSIASPGLNEFGNEGALENFDFDSFLHGQDEIFPFTMTDFNFNAGAEQELPLKTNLEPLSSSQSYQQLYVTPTSNSRPDIASKAPDTASGSSLELSDQRQAHIIAQEQLLRQDPQQISEKEQSTPPQQNLPHAAPKEISRQEQSQMMRHEQQAQTQSTQDQAQAATQSIPGTSQTMFSPTMPMLNKPVPPPDSRPVPSMPMGYRPTILQVNGSPQKSVEGLLHYPSHSRKLNLSPALAPPSMGNHALQDYQNQLMLLEQQNRKRLLDSRQAQDNNNQLKRGHIPVESCMSGERQRQDLEASQHISSWPNVATVNNENSKERERVRIRKSALRIDQRNCRRRVLKACYNCQTLKVKVASIQLIFWLCTDLLQCDYTSPCSSCTKRNAEQEELPIETCRETNITEHLQGFPVEVGSTGLSLPQEQYDKIESMTDRLRPTGPERSARREPFVPSATRNPQASNATADMDARAAAQIGGGFPSLSDNENGWVNFGFSHGDRNSYDYQDNPFITFNPSQTLHISTGAGVQAVWDASFPFPEPTNSNSLKPAKRKFFRRPSPSLIKPSQKKMLSPEVPQSTGFISNEEDEDDEEISYRVRSKKRRKTKEYEDEIVGAQSDLELVDNDTADVLFPLFSKDKPIEIRTTLNSADRDIVDVLLEEWTVPVY
jgi:hypothetical protein